MRRSRPCPIALGILLCASASAAQPLAMPAHDLERFTLDPSGGGSLVVGGARLLPAGAFRLVVAGHFERNPLLLNVGGSTAGALVANRSTVHVDGAWGPTDRLELGFDLPLIADQTGADLTRYGLASPASSGLANPLLHGRFAFVSAADGGAALGLRLTLGLPIGSKDALGGGAGMTTASATPALEASLPLGPMLLSAQAGVLLRSAEPLDTRKLSSEAIGALALGLPDNAFRPEIMVRGDVPLGDLPAGMEVLAGLSHALGSPSIRLFALGGAGLGSLPGIPAYRVLAGLSYTPSAAPPARSEPIAPIVEKPAVAAVVVASAPACPPAPACPQSECAACPACAACAVCPVPVATKADPCAPGTFHQPADCPALDDDGDGVPNGGDKCPLERGAQATSGCPAPDRDHDGIADLDDRCPAEFGPSDNLGCPLKDADGDSVADVVDNCPAVKGVADNQGCAKEEPQQVVITRERINRVRSRIKLKAAVNFESGKAVVPAASFAVLDQVASLLAAHPELAKLRVEGHTDNQGAEKANLKLSDARAKAVQAYLEGHGVKKGRLSAKGFGPSLPLDSNENEPGRAKNRRVELVSAEEGADR